MSNTRRPGLNGAARGLICAPDWTARSTQPLSPKLSTGRPVRASSAIMKAWAVSTMTRSSSPSRQYATPRLSQPLFVGIPSFQAPGSNTHFVRPVAASIAATWEREVLV
jgi:hypothetical protein